MKILSIVVNLLIAAACVAGAVLSIYFLRIDDLGFYPNTAFLYCSAIMYSLFSVLSIVGIFVNK